MNKEEKRKYSKEYSKRPEVIKKKKEYMKMYWQRPSVKEHVRNQKKEYRNRPEVKNKLKKYKKNYAKNYWNREEVKSYQKRYKKNLLENNKSLLIGKRVRCFVLWIINYHKKTGRIINSKKYPLDIKGIISHLGLPPDNEYVWHIDHIKPLCDFDLEDSNQFREAFAPENHQWLTAEENLSKGSKY